MSYHTHVITCHYSMLVILIHHKKCVLLYTRQYQYYHHKGLLIADLYAETLKSLEIQVLVAQLGLLPQGAKSRSKGQLVDLLMPRLLDAAATSSEVWRPLRPIPSLPSCLSIH